MERRYRTEGHKSCDSQALGRKTNRLTLQRMTEVWGGILGDKDGLRALERLNCAGFQALGQQPRDQTLRQACWADYIAAIPLVPYQLSRRRVSAKASSQACSSVVRVLRELKDNLESQFCEVSLRGVEAVLEGAGDNQVIRVSSVTQRLTEVADLIEDFSRWRWATRHRNPRNALIAGLRWAIREKTGTPHDADLSALIDAAFRAAGKKEGLYIDATALDRIEKREKESRVKAAARFRSH